MRLRKLIEALTELSVQRGPDVEIRTMPVFMFDPSKGRKPGVCSFYVGEQTGLSNQSKRVKTTRTVIMEVS